MPSNPAPSTPAPPGLWKNVWSRPVGRVLDHVVYNTRVVGAELVPGSGPVIFAANHTSVLDGPVMVGAAPRYMNVLVKQEMFHGFIGQVLVQSGQMPVNRTGDRSVLQMCKAILDADRCVGILPEGSRGGGDVSTISGGVAWLALATGAPIVPVGIVGTRRSGESIGHIPKPRRRFEVHFGTPLELVFDDSLTGRQRMTAATEQIRGGLAQHVAAVVDSSGIALPQD